MTKGNHLPKRLAATLSRENQTLKNSCRVGERDQSVRKAIIALPPHYRAVIELRHFQELSYEEIAQTLHCPVSAVKINLFRARRMLAGRLAGIQKSESSCLI